MQSSLVSLIKVLRSHNLRISPAETLDAMQVANQLGYTNRAQLRDGLAMALTKTLEDESVFLQCFDQFFKHELAALEVNDSNTETVNSNSENGALGAPVPAASKSLLEEAATENPQLQALIKSPLMTALINSDRNALTLAIIRTGDGVGLKDIQMFTQRGQFTRKILDAMGEAQLRTAVVDLEREQSTALPALQHYRDILREQVRAHVERQYLLHAKGHDQQFMDEVLSQTKLSNIEHRYLHKVQELVRKMARKLASRHAHKRRPCKRGQLNMAQTMRKGIANDGVMFNTYWRRARHEKPQILAICDVSGSVAAYAKFLLLFLYSVQAVLPRVRSFAFSSHLGEVSQLFADLPVEKAIERVNWTYGGATDYGNSLMDFSRLALNDINRNTTVIILGDARNNNGDPKIEVMQSIYQRARQVIWLNPESRRAWGSGDSIMLRYKTACHFASECNNLKQLERFIDLLLKTTR